MFRCRKNQFWLENFTSLACSAEMVPLQGMGLASQLNAVTRLTLIIFVVLLLLNVSWAPLFLLLSILFIIILYYIQKSQMNMFTAENFETLQSKVPMNAGKLPHADLSAARVKWINDVTLNPRPGLVSSIIKPESAGLFCHDLRPLDYNPELVRKNVQGPNPDGIVNNQEYVSMSQRLAGPVNPKTLIAPVITPPCADLEYWRANNLVNHSAVNAESQVEAYQSGYQTTSCCPGEPTLLIPKKNPADYEVPVQIENNILENFETNPSYLEKPDIELQPAPQVPCSNQIYPGQQKEDFKYNMPFLKTAPDLDDTVVLTNEPGWVNTSCGYNPDQLFEAGLPTNLPAGNCPQDPIMKQYNDNLFTQIIEPGITTRNQINEPINSNIGISFTQQLPPTTCETNELTGEIEYTEHDPRIIEPATVSPSLPRVALATESNIYDPRFSGYGTSYRAYTDENIGQTRFYYDDVDAIRMPNYIVRSNIDHQPFADHYGPLPPGDANGNKFNSNIRALANDAFLTGTLQFRTDLQERLMRKTNAEAWQQRAAPIYKGGQRMSTGGMGYQVSTRGCRPGMSCFR